MFCLKFFEVPIWYQNFSTTSLAEKCFKRTDEFLMMLEQNVHQTLFFVERIESRIKKVSG